MNRPPNSKVNLDRAIQRLYGTGARFVEYRSIIANTIVGQFLPDGVVKGGSALKLRYGCQATRMTTDFDTAYRTSIDQFIEDVRKGLSVGWGDFTGEVVRRPPAKPVGIPAEYVMQPFDVKLKYRNAPWCTVNLEVGYDEIGDAQHSEPFIDASVVEVFKTLCLPLPKPVPLMSLEYQVAQKLHGVSEPGGKRAHDLIDLQLIFSRSNVDIVETRRIVVRLFANRQRQTWPTMVAKGEGWDELYAAAKGELPVRVTVDEAVEWVNDLISRIDAAR